jgi:tripartite-type tricarboxylate transporter receptor subunit TctC
MRPTRAALASITIATLTACARTGHLDEWPVRPVRIVVPFAPGGGADLVARLVAPRLSEGWRQPVVIDNRPGSDGVAGVQAFVSSNDRHTLLFTPAGQVTLSPLLHARLPFDPERDLVPIAAAVAPSIGIAVGRDVSAASLPDLARLARQQPERYLWAGVAGLPELIFKAFLEIEKAPMKHVPYRDPSAALHDLGAGRIHAMVGSVATLSPLVQSGSARLLVVTTSTRLAAAPEVPTTTEAGYPVLTAGGKWGFYGWRDMPVALRDRISTDIRNALDDAALAEKLSAVGLVVAPGDAAEFASTIDAQRLQVHEIARIIGLTPPPAPGGR